MPKVIQGIWALLGGYGLKWNLDLYIRTQLLPNPQNNVFKGHKEDKVSVTNSKARQVSDCQNPEEFSTKYEVDRLELENKIYRSTGQFVF